MLPNLGNRFFLIGLSLAVSALVLLFGGEFNQGLDIRGGTSLIYHIDEAVNRDELEETKEVMRQRVDKLGLKEITITTDPRHRDIIIELPGMSAQEAATVKRTLTELGKLIWAIEATEEELHDPEQGLGPEFKVAAFLEQVNRRVRELVQQDPEQYDPHRYTGEAIPLYKNPRDWTRPAFPGQKPRFVYYPPYRWYSKRRRRWMGPPQGAIVHTREDLRIPGEWVKSVYPARGTLETVVGFELKAEYKDRFRDLTRRNKGRNLAIIFNDKLVTNPVIRGVIPGVGVIEGIGEREEIRRLIVTIKSGSLRIKPRLYMEQQIGPTLGEDAIRRGQLAIVAGSLAVLVFMLVVYRLGGLLANAALIMNLLLLLAVMKLMGATLSLPGIAGIILTVGIAVDANILIFERIREEREKGKTFIQAVKNGYDRATVTILDANLTTLITGVVLYLFGTGPIKGFAFVLIAGLLANLFTAIYMTKTVMAWLIKTERVKDLRILRLFRAPAWNFLRFGNAALVGSGLVIAAGLYVFFGVQGKDIAGLDFAGGGLMRVQLKQPEEIAQFRSLVQRVAGSDVDVVTVKGAAAETGAGGRGSTIFEIKKSVDEKEAEKFFTTVRRVLHERGLLVEEPVIPHPAYDGDDPGRVPPIKEPKTDAEKRDATVPGGFRFTINFYEPQPASVLERNLEALKAPARHILPRDELPGPRHKSYEVWCAAGPYRVGVKQLHDLITDLAQRLREERPKAVHLSDPVPVQRFIGPRVAHDLIQKAVLAIVVAIGLLIVYIRVRFKDIAYGVGASVALVHDVLVTMGAIAFFDWLGLVHVKISLPIIAAFLTLIGYSLNDTIVIFDRLRENLGRAPMPLRDAMNLSIGQSLTRTINTSLTTFFVVACLFAFNYGQRGVLEGLGFALMVGVVTGTYSTVFIACPTVLLLKRKEPGVREAARRRAREAAAAKA